MTDGSTILGLTLLVLIFGGLLMLLILLKEFFLRPRDMKKLADKFNLGYRLNNGNAFLSRDQSRNIIEGKIGNHDIKIHDTVETYDIPVTFYGTGAKRYTQLTIDSQENKLTGFISGYYPVGKLEKKLADLKFGRIPQ